MKASRESIRGLCAECSGDPERAIVALQHRRYIFNIAWPDTVDFIELSTYGHEDSTALLSLPLIPGICLQVDLLWLWEEFTPYGASCDHVRRGGVS